MVRILVTGSYGQIGSELVPALRDKYGTENVIATGRRKIPDFFRGKGPYYYLDVVDQNKLAEIVVDQDVDWIIHNAGILSATGEKNPQLALHTNTVGMNNVMEIAKQYKLRVLAPSSIAAFGPSTPRDNTPNQTIMRPTTMYGVTKVYVELLGEYYFNKWNVDFRSLRYPGVISAETLPGGGTTDYAVEIFYEALQKGKYACFLKSDASLPMMIMQDCIKCTIDLMEAERAKLTECSYNVTAVSFTPEELATEIKKHLPNFEITYQPDFRQKIAESWPCSINDSQARKDWGWSHDFGLAEMTKYMIERLREKLKII